MIKSFRGKNVDMASLAIKYKNTIALGNASMDGEGNLIKNGKIYKTREEVLAESKIANVTQSGLVNLKSEIEEDINETLENIKVAKATKKPVYSDITEEEIEELEKNKE